MSVFNLFSYRKRLAAGDTPDVFVYDQLPRGLRVQISQILADAIGPYYVGSLPLGLGSPPNNNEAWEMIHKIVAREHEMFTLGDDHLIDHRCLNYFLDNTSVDKALDVIEVSFSYIVKDARNFDPYYREACGIQVTADDAVAELNERFRRAGVGYRFEDLQIFRVDSELIHSEVVRPVLRYLHEKGFAGRVMNSYGRMPTSELAKRKARSQMRTTRSRAR